MEKLIVVKQLPVIEEQLKLVKANIEQRVSDALQLACTEETVKDVKAVRAELNKSYAELETQRKQVKKAVLEPYEAFEAVYKDCTGAFTKADAELKSKIAAVENGLKQQKADELKAYYNEFALANKVPLDLAPFERANLKIGMSDSMKKLQGAAASFLLQIADDLKAIEAMDAKEEVMVEYRKLLNLAQAQNIVNARRIAIEEENRRREEMKARMLAAAEAEKKAAECAAEPEPIPEPFTPPVEEEAEEDPEEIPEPAEEDPVFCASFNVYGTISQLRALKNFLMDGGYEYEQC